MNFNNVRGQLFIYLFSLIYYQSRLLLYYQIILSVSTKLQSPKMLSKYISSRMYLFSKIYSCPKQATKDIKDNSKILVGGFGICGIPMNLINALKQSGVKNLTCVSNNCGYGDKSGTKYWGLAQLLQTKQIKRMISSYVGENPQFQRQYNTGQLQLQICPQGTLAEKIRSGGAGIPAFYTATGVGTLVEEGGFPIKYKKGTDQVEIASVAKPTAVFNGKKYVMQQSIRGDFALVKAKKADKHGNLVFNKTARNFNADMCTAANCVIAQVQQIVEIGQINPDQVHVPGVFIDRIYKSDPKSPFSQKRIQKLTLRQEKKPQQPQGQKKQQKSAPKDDKKSQKSQDQKARKQAIKYKIMNRAAKQVKNGMNVNLGIGIPTLLPSVLPPEVKINLQSQNGIFGVGPYPRKGQEDPDLIDAGKATITINPGGSFFSSSQSFAIIRGGHLDLTMLGAMEVSEKCDIANWIIPKILVKGMGGAMDLVACGSRVIVVMQHIAKDSLKLLQTCKYPLTAKGVVSMVITELAVFQNQKGKLILTEIAQQTTLQQVKEKTGFKIDVKADKLKRF